MKPNNGKFMELLYNIGSTLKKVINKELFKTNSMVELPFLF
jgi:hypothetical protein